MAETSVAALESHLQKQVESARVAYGRGNFDYTIALCRAVLRETPNCLSVRKLHRTAALRLQHGSGSPFALALGALPSVPVSRNPAARPDDEPLAAVENSETMLENDPHSTTALRLLGRAAATLGWRETAIFAFESICEESPGDAENLVALGEAQLAAGHAGAAVAAAEEALKIAPVSNKALVLLRGASAAHTVKVGRWEESGELRDNLHR